MEHAITVGDLLTALAVIAAVGIALVLYAVWAVNTGRAS
jgi:hypothetical protein